jgi:hypothetical protein
VTAYTSFSHLQEYPATGWDKIVVGLGQFSKCCTAFLSDASLIFVFEKILHLNQTGWVYLSQTQCWYQLDLLLLGLIAVLLCVL